MGFMGITQPKSEPESPFYVPGGTLPPTDLPKRALTSDQREEFRARGLLGADNPPDFSVEPFPLSYPWLWRGHPRNLTSWLWCYGRFWSTSATPGQTFPEPPLTAPIRQDGDVAPLLVDGGTRQLLVQGAIENTILGVMVATIPVAGPLLVLANSLSTIFGWGNWLDLTCFSGCPRPRLPNSLTRLLCQLYPGLAYLPMRNIRTPLGWDGGGNFHDWLRRPGDASTDNWDLNSWLFEGANNITGWPDDTGGTLGGFSRDSDAPKLNYAQTMAWLDSDPDVAGATIFLRKLMAGADARGLLLDWAEERGYIIVQPGTTGPGVVEVLPGLSVAPSPEAPAMAPAAPEPGRAANINALALAGAGLVLAGLFIR